MITYLDGSSKHKIHRRARLLLQSSNEIDAECDIVTSGRSKAEWQEVDRRLREYARHRSALDAAEAFDLVRAEQLKIYVSFGFVTLYEYLERVLGYKPHAARERMRVARALAALPKTTAALARGALTYSAVRELTRVATADTETTWLAAAEGMVANQIERLVANHHLGDPAQDDRLPRAIGVPYELPMHLRMIRYLPESLQSPPGSP